MLFRFEKDRWSYSDRKTVFLVHRDDFGNQHINLWNSENMPEMFFEELREEFDRAFQFISQVGRTDEHAHEAVRKGNWYTRVAVTVGGSSAKPAFFVAERDRLESDRPDTTLDHMIFSTRLIKQNAVFLLEIFFGFS